ncbi:MAG: transketolase C-terminal domain-containing protein [Thermoplasmata archaeon]
MKNMVKKVITGNSAAAYGVKLARVQVVSAYPITPQTTVVEKLAEFVANGELDAKFVNVESEHSALAALISASLGGARTFTATSSHGLTLMHEMLHWAAGARTPVVMVNVNRAMGPPWNIWAEMTDSISQRDTGWIQFYGESNQEVLDTMIQLYKICEDRDVMLPGMVCEDAFYLSHTVLPVDIPSQEDVDRFLPSFVPAYKLDFDNPVSVGSLSMPHQWYMELRFKIAESMENAKKKIVEVDREFGKVFGRTYGGLVEPYLAEDADLLLICAGTMASTAKDVVDELRKDGIMAGLIRLRVFRPFPNEEIVKLTKNASVIGVADRAISFGNQGPFFTEVKGAIYGKNNVKKLKNYIVGIGGRDITTTTIKNIFRNMAYIKEHGVDEEVTWVELKR